MTEKRKRKRLPASLALVPGMARPNPIVVDGKKVPESVQQSILAFEHAIGGRQALIEQLSSGDCSPEVQEVLTIIADPRHDHLTLAVVCARAGISPGQLFQSFRHAAVARAQVLAMLEVANRVPQITEQLLAEAISHTTPCTSCNGVGTKTPEPSAKNPEPKPFTCGACQGLGTLHVPADLERQKIALELANLLKKAGGIAIQTNVNVPAPASKGGSLEQLQQAIGEIMYGRAGGGGGREDPTPDAPSSPPVDGEVV